MVFLKCRHSFFIGLIICIFLTCYPLVTTATFNIEDFVYPDTNYLQITYLDVGQGDSIIIKFPNGKTMLIDGGPTEASEVVFNGLALMGINKLNYVVSTHPDIDHIGGLLDILRLFPVGKIYDSGKTYDTLTYLDYIRLIEERHIPFKVVHEGNKLWIDPNVSITILNSGEGKGNNNDASIVLLLTYRNIDFLLAADCTRKIEGRLIKKYGLDAEVLKVAHHGSHTSTSMRFLKAVNPSYAVISFEKKNPFHHPHSTVMKRLNKMGISVYTTADDGDVEMKSDGYHLWIEGKEVRNHLSTSNIGK